MIDLLAKGMAPLLLLLMKVLGLRILRDSALETLDAQDELARRAANGDATSRALLASFGQNVAAIMGAEGPGAAPPAGPAGPTKPAPLGASAPFALGGAAPAGEANPSPAAGPKRRGRPAKPRFDAASPPNGDAQGSGADILRNGNIH